MPKVFIDLLGGRRADDDAAWGAVSGCVGWCCARYNIRIRPCIRLPEIALGVTHKHERARRDAVVYI